MNDPTDDRLLSFLEGRMDPGERGVVLDALDADPTLAERVHAAARGLEAIGELEPTTRSASRNVSAQPRRGRVPTWWIPAAVAAALTVAVPVTVRVTGHGVEPSAALLQTGIPESSTPTFVVLLHGRWSDAGAVPPEEVSARAQEYWAWTSSLARSGLLVAAGDLRWEAGERLTAGGDPVLVSATTVAEDDFVVGMLALRVGSYEEARRVASQCPHLRYGGSVSVRRVGAGFVTVPGMGDWTE